MTTLPDWPRALGPPLGTAAIRVEPEDFFVDELMDHVPDGEGEFLWVRVEKRDHNTAWAAQKLAEWAGVTARAVSYAGLKDRHALTRQWFSVHLPGLPDPDSESFSEPGIRLLELARHRRKLRTGAHRGNRFVLLLRDLAFENCQGPEQLEARLKALVTGIPNYFGPQRFGRCGENLRQARALYAGRRRQRGRRLTGLLHSAARGFLFNQVLARRVTEGNWNRGLEGETWMLTGSRSVFGPEPMTDTLRQRCAEGDISPTGPLPGIGREHADTEASRLEAEVLAQHPELLDGLQANKLRAARRSLVLRAGNLDWSLVGQTLKLSFDLPAGQYATTLLRELVAC